MDGRKILLIVVLIILFFLAATNIKNLTGKVFGGEFKIEIYPKAIDCGRYDNSKVINIFANTGPSGLDNKFYLHREDGTRVGGSSNNLCMDSICKGQYSKNYRIGCELNSGRYFFRFTRENKDLTIDSEEFVLTHSG